MKLYIYADEYYPYFGLANLDSNYGKSIEVTTKEGRWIIETLEEFEKIQKFLKEKYNE